MYLLKISKFQKWFNNCISRILGPIFQIIFGRKRGMTDAEKAEILGKAQSWFTTVIAQNHIVNTRKLKNPDKFHINPFLAVYLANFLCGNSHPESIAKALIYPRVLGTSITTSFGQNMQSFASQVLASYGSTTSGIDIEFIDCIDGIKKYCQLKAGPNTINSADVETIAGYFSSVIRLGRTNNTTIPHASLVVGVLYGDELDLSSHYKRITEEYHYPVIVGKDFWHRLTGEADFYADIIKAIGEVARNADFSSELEGVIRELAASDEVQKLSEEVQD
jgi:hypothetical protein